jgi:hypothetical protein
MQMFFTLVYNISELSKIPEKMLRLKRRRVRPEQTALRPFGRSAVRLRGD